MLKAYKYRIYSNKEQEEFFAKIFGCCRFVWNKMLEEKLSAYRNRVPIPQTIPAKYKKDFPFLREVDSLALTNVQLQLEKAFKNHFKNPKSFVFPQLKRKKYKQSYTTNNVNNSIKVDFEKGLLYLPKIKKLKTKKGIKIKLHRTFEGKIKSATLNKTKNGEYYVSILVETEEPRNKVTEPKSGACGVDLGLKHFATITNDLRTYKVEHPKYLRRKEKKLKKSQKDLSRKKKGSSNYEKLRRKLAKLHAYISNARNDFLHKLFKTIIDENQVVVVEDINVKRLVKSNFIKSISDSGWSKFLAYLRYKAEWYGRTFVQVDKFFPSSKLCHCCGHKIKDLALHKRTWVCSACGEIHDRDVNASINLYFVGLERPEVKPVEHALVDDRIPLGYLKSHHAEKQEATPSIRCGSSQELI
jgi:putative transposase